VSFASFILYEENGLQGYAQGVLQKPHDEVKKVVKALNRDLENKVECLLGVTEIFAGGTPGENKIR